jgi:hypothetical protein
MKKVLLLVLIGMLVVPFTTMAQLKIKPAFGINFASINTDKFKMDGKTGYMIGGTVAIGSKFVFEPGIFWQKDNYEVDDAWDTGKDVIKGDYSAIKIPVYLGYYIIGDAKSTLGVRLFGGPSAKFVISENDNGIPDEFSDINNAIWGVKVGAGVEVSIVFAELGYNWGLNEVFKGINNSQTNHFELTFGLKF